MPAGGADAGETPGVVASMVGLGAKWTESIVKSLPDKPWYPFVRRYVKKADQDRPLLLVEEEGSDGVEMVKLLLEREGYFPVVVEENIEVPLVDTSDRRLFPVYVLRTPEMPLSVPSMVVVPVSFDIKKATGPKGEFQGCEFALVGLPTLPEREDYLALLGAPVSLANGNPTYGDLFHASIAWAVGGVEIRAEPPKDTDWDGFKQGNPPPVPEGLVPYYLAYSGLFPPEDTWTNRNIGQAMRAPRAVRNMLWDQIRLELPMGAKLPFPSLFLDKADRRKEKGSPSSGSVDSGTTVSAPKAYSIDWD